MSNEELASTEGQCIIENFKTESGVTLPEVRITYGTYGTLNAAKDNAVLLPSSYMAPYQGYEWLIGPGKALDLDKYFVISTEAFGNGRSSSPSNTSEPFHGPRFPAISTRDNVNAVHQLLTTEFQIHHLQAVIGFSMGAQQAFQWAVSFPDFMDCIVATAGAAKTYGHGIVRLDGQISALTADENFNDGDYTTPPTKGLQAFGQVWAGWLMSQEWWRRELWRDRHDQGRTFDQAVAEFRNGLATAGDANDLILQMCTWREHDVGMTSPFNGDIAAALESIQVPVLYMPSTTDLYFPMNDAEYEAGYLKQGTLLPIDSLWGHTAGAGSNSADAEFLNESIAAFLSRVVK
jgi:homoserine O-acetyltransferase